MSMAEVLELLLLRVLHDRLRLLRSISTASRCSYQPIASASSVSEAIIRANVRVSGRQLLRRLVVLVEAHGRRVDHLRRTGNADSGARRRSVPEMPPAGEDHRRAGSRTAAITSASRFEPPGWTIAARRPRARAAARRRRGRTRRGERGARRASWPLPRLLDRDPNRVDAAHLSGADPDRLQPRASTIAFEVTCLHTRQAKSRSPQPSSSARRRRPPSRRGRRCPGRGPGRAARRDALVVALARAARAARMSCEDRTPASAASASTARRRSRARTAPRRTAPRAARRVALDGPVQTTTPPYADRVGGERPVVRLLDRLRRGRRRRGSRA